MGEQILVAICPWCDEPVGGEAIQYGSERLHPACHDEMGQEMGHVETLMLINHKGGVSNTPYLR